MSEYIYWIHAVATDKQSGNAVASLVAAEPGDATSFNNATAVFPAGTVFTPSQSGIGAPTASNPPAAWYVGVACKQSAYEVAAEFAGNGPYPLLNARGMTDAQIAAAKAHVTVFAGPRSTTEPNWRAYIESLGYTLP